MLFTYITQSTVISINLADIQGFVDTKLRCMVPYIKMGITSGLTSERYGKTVNN